MKPIPFSTPMVQAILNGNKTQTRRVTKTQPDYKHNYRYDGIQITDLGIYHFLEELDAIGEPTEHYENIGKCPYGNVGDILWVREEHLIEFAQANHVINVTYEQGFQNFYYKELTLNLLKKLHARKTIGKWQRARFLPKELARLFLKIKSIRVERLQDITNLNSRAEGILSYTDKILGERFKDYSSDASGYGDTDHDYPSVEGPRQSFFSLWEKINGVDSLISNPFVWVIEFERIEKPKE